MEGLKNAYKVLVGKPEGKRPHERARRSRRILEWIVGKQWEIVDRMHLTRGGLL
jgi:hypothetical protein